jgi:hypothetical protein
VKVEIRPEPSDGERAAIVTALERLLGDDSRVARSAWWEAGLREAVGDEDEPDPFAQATALPRSSPGATRA